MTDLVGQDQPGRADPAPDAEPTTLLAEVHASMLRLLAELPRLPERIRISAQDIVVELAWPAEDRPAAPQGGAGIAQSGAVAPAAEQPAPGEDSRPSPADGHQVTAATVGTFYRAPEPGAPPFVEVGDPVRAGQQIAIVEAMKLMIPVEADVDGLVREVLKDDGEPVEFGEPLILIERS